MSQDASSIDPNAIAAAPAAAPAADPSAAAPAPTPEPEEPVLPEVDATNKDYLGKLVEIHGYANVLNALGELENAKALTSLTSGDRKGVLNAMKIGTFLAATAERISKVGKKKGAKGEDDAEDDADADDAAAV